MRSIPSQSTGIRRFSPCVSKRYPASLGARHAMTAFPWFSKSISSLTRCQTRSRWRLSQLPTYTPARISNIHTVKRPRRRGATFSVTMTIISSLLRVGDCRTDLISAGFRHLEPTGLEHVLNRGNQLVEHPTLAKRIPTGPTHLSSRIARMFRGDFKRQRHHRLKLKEVGNVVDKRARFSG